MYYMLNNLNEIIMDHIGLMTFIFFSGVLIGMLFNIGLYKVIKFLEKHSCCHDEGQQLYNYEIDKNHPTKY